jgi:hypothetical protein
MSNTKTRKLTIVRTPTHPLRLEPGEAVHVGVDVHKATSCCRRSPRPSRSVNARRTLWMPKRPESIQHHDQVSLLLGRPDLRPPGG